MFGTSVFFFFPARVPRLCQLRKMLRGDLTTHRLMCTQLIRAGRSQWCETNNLLPGHKPLEPSDHLTDSAQEGVLVGGSRNDDSEIQLPDPRGLSE